MRRRGFTLLELVIVLGIIAVVGAIMVPRMRPNPYAQVDQWARYLAQDLDLVRSRALATSSMARASISDSTWALYLDDNRDSVIAETAAEREALGPLNQRFLKDAVQAGRGSAPALPSDPSPSTPTTGVTRRITFGPRGTTEPFGDALVIYFTNRRAPGAVRAIEINAAANVRVWKWQDGTWQ